MDSCSIVGLICCICLIIFASILCYFSFKDTQKQIREQDLFRSLVVDNLKEINKKVGGN